MWQIPIYDRTAANVAEGADKCYMNAETLNRIEGNTAYMASLLGAKVSTRHWEATDFLTRSEMERLMQNIQAVRDAYFVLPGTSDLPEEPTTLYTGINAMEEVLWSLHELWQRNSIRRYTGEICAGQAIGVI